MIYLSSDLHFNHSKEFIYKARGFETIEEMNEGIIERFNMVVSENDDLYILGDLCLGGANSLETNKELIERLNGHLHIILGNHDTQRRIEMYQKCKNVESLDYATIVKYGKYRFYLSHYPTLTGNLEKESLKQMTLNIFGHTHQKEHFFRDLPYMYNIGVDAHNCYPVLLDNILIEMKLKVDSLKADLDETVK